MESCLIIGAGLAGIVAARQMQKKGIKTQILEKAKGVGGRLATREIEAAQFDFGAQFLTAHGMTFKVLVEDMEDAGIVKPWCRGFLNGDKILHLDGYLRLCGTQGMKEVAKFLARDLEISKNQTVIQISQNAKDWTVTTESGQSWSAEALIMTPPLPQTLGLIEKNSNINLEEKLYKRLKEIKYEPCITLMATLDQPSGLPEPGGLSSTDPMSPIGWIGDNQAKKISEVPAVTIHGTGHFSRKFWKAERDAAAEILLEKAKDFLRAEVVSYQVHKWKYATPKSLWPEAYLSLNQTPPLYLAGDAFSTNQNFLEGAVMSGFLAAKALLKQEGL